jgi:hypothetical protein
MIQNQLHVSAKYGRHQAEHKNKNEIHLHVVEMSGIFI